MNFYAPITQFQQSIHDQFYFIYTRAPCTFLPDYFEAIPVHHTNFICKYM